MTSNKDNSIFEKTSFLQGSNTPFIQDLYIQYLNNPKNIPQSWANFFDGLGEDQKTIEKEILGPSWVKKKNFNFKKNITIEKNIENKKSLEDKKLISSKSYENEKEQ